MEKVVVELGELTWGDLDDIEALCGDLGSLYTGRMSAKFLTALVYVAGRRQDPAFTLDAARAVPVSAVDIRGDLVPAISTEDLTLGEFEELETALGEVGPDEFARPGAKLLRTIAYVLGRRQDPDLTYEETAEWRLAGGPSGRPRVEAGGDS